MRNAPGRGPWTAWPPVVLSGSAFVPLFMLGGFFPVIQHELHATAGFLGLVVSLFYLSSTVGYAVRAAVVDSLPTHVVVRCGVVMIALASALIAWPADSGLVLVPAVMVAGVGHAMVQTAGNTWLARSALRPALMFGAKQSSASAAGMVAGILVAVAPPAEWRSLFLFVGIATGLGAFLIRRPESSGVAEVPLGTRVAVTSLWPSALVALLGAAVALTTSSYLAAFVVDLEFEVSFAGKVIFAASLVCVVSRLAVGRMLDGAPEMARFACSAAWGLGAVGFVMLAQRQASVPLIITAAVLAYGIGWAWTGALLYTVTREFPANPGRTTGLIQTAASVGGMVGPLVAGQGIERWGYQPLWVVCCVLAALSACLVVIRPGPGRQLSAVS